MAFIDLTSPSYNNLSTIGVLASSGITSVNATTINNGYWGSYATASYSANLVAGATPSGLAPSPAYILAAQNGLTQLKTDISVYTGTLGAPVNLSTYTGSSVTLLPNTNYRGTNITFTTSTINFDAGGNSNAQFFINDAAASTFTTVNINLLNAAKACNIFWVAAAGITFSATPNIYGNLIAGTAITFTVTSPATQNIYGHVYAGSASVSFSGTTNVNTLTCPQPIVCYAKGTLILTKQGFVPIENIKAGHKVVTKGKIYKNQLIQNSANLKIEPVMWVSKFKVIDLNSNSRPICIQKDALGKNYPFKDLYVSPNHSLLLDGKMVVAKDIVNETTIYQDTECDKVEYYHLECEQHSAIFANGVLSESYLDVNNRDVFENSIRLRRKIYFRPFPRNLRF